jgi:hypothetical protein
MSGKYTKGTQQLMSGNVDLIAGDIMAVLVDSTFYTPDLEVDESLAFIPDSAILSDTPIDSKSLDGTALKAGDSTFQKVVAERNADLIVVALDAKTKEACTLISVHDIAAITTVQDEEVVVDWDALGIVGY